MKKSNLKVMTSVMMALVFAVTSVCVPTGTVSASDTIAIDGSFSDWDSVSHQDVSSYDSYYSDISFVYDDDYLYIHAVEDEGSYYGPYTSLNLVGKDSSGTSYQVVMTPGNTSDGVTTINVKNQSWADLSGAKGYRKFKTTDNNATQGEWEVKVPLSYFGDDLKSVTVQLGNPGDTITPTLTSLSDAKDDTKTTEAPTPEATAEATANANNTSSDVSSDTSSDKVSSTGIVIDGSYSDWSEYPHSYVINWNMPDSQRNDNNCRQIAITNDDTYVYVEVTMITPSSSNGTSESFNGNYFTLKADDATVNVYFVDQNGNSFPNGNSYGETTQIYAYYLNGQPNVKDNTQVENSLAYMYVKSGEATKCEFRIPFTAFEKVTGSDVSDVKEISVSNPNVMNNTVSTAGSSTLPYIGAAIALVIAAGAVFAGIRARKKKRVA